MSWTDARTDRLKVLWKEGWSAEEIARDLGGVTRNAVIGKVHRMKLPKRLNPKLGSNVIKVKPRSSNTVQVKSRIENARLKAKEKAKPAKPIKPAHVNVDIMGLERHHCRYVTRPAPDALYCGQVKREDSAYCADHHAKCYTGFKAKDKR